MIIDIKVDLSECYAEEIEGDPDLGVCATASLSEEIHNVVKYEVKQAISKQVGKDVRELAEKAYKELAEEKMKILVDHELESFLREGKVKKSSRTDELVPINEKLRGIFDDFHGWNTPYDRMQKMAKEFGDELKKRYDLAFASSIVDSLKKQGLLIDGVEKLLKKGLESETQTP